MVLIKRTQIRRLSVKMASFCHESHVQREAGHDSLVNMLHRPIKCCYSSRSLVFVREEPRFRSRFDRKYVDKAVVNCLHGSHVQRPCKQDWARNWCDYRSRSQCHVTKNVTWLHGAVNMLVDAEQVLTIYFKLICPNRETFVECE